MLNAKIRLIVICTLAAPALLGFAFTINRVPIEYGDGPFYASIARSMQQGGAGIPSELIKGGPTAIDHVRFYGPVFFSTLATAFRWLGFSSLTFRLVCVFGAILVVAGGIAICASIGGGPDRRIWIGVLLLLSPELGFAATFGRMDPFAVGLEMLGLAAFVHGITHQRRPRVHGIVSGLLLSAAALTTPRTFPFMLGFAVAGLAILPRSLPDDRRHVWTQLAACAAVFAGVALTWTAVSSGGPRTWLRMMSFIATHEDTDVALLRVAREWVFVWWQSLTLGFAIVGAVVAAGRLHGRQSHTLAAEFALVATWTTLVVTWTLFQYVFLFSTYAILPLFAVVIAVPTPMSDTRRHGAAFLAACLLFSFAGVRVAKMTRAAVTWSARDPERVTAFVRAHIPPGSKVVGLNHDYFFAVEEGGSRYLIASQVSGADWSRWMARIEGRPEPPLPALDADYVLWPTAHVDAAPPALRCAMVHALATYTPPPDDIPGLSWLAEEDAESRYPAATLFAMDTPECRRAQADR